jgi:hypothetical protein
MTDIALTVKEVFPHSRLVDFFNQGKMEAAAHQIFRWLGGKTYEEWFEYFEANDFKPKNWREAPVFAKIMAVLYQGMVLEAEDATQSWLVLSKGQREEYKREALALAKRKRVSWSFWEALELAFYSFLVFHNFFKDFDLMEESLDKFVAIIFEAVVSEQEISNIAYKRDEGINQSTPPTLKKIQDWQEEQDIEETIALIDSWETKYTTEEMHETLEKLKKGIDEDRQGGRKLFS